MYLEPEVVPVPAEKLPLVDDDDMSDLSVALTIVGSGGTMADVQRLPRARACVLAHRSACIVYERMLRCSCVGLDVTFFRISSGRIYIHYGDDGDADGYADGYGDGDDGDDDG